MQQHARAEGSALRGDRSPVAFVVFAVLFGAAEVCVSVANGPQWIAPVLPVLVSSLLVFTVWVAALRWASSWSGRVLLHRENRAAFNLCFAAVLLLLLSIGIALRPFGVAAERGAFAAVVLFGHLSRGLSLVGCASIIVQMLFRARFLGCNGTAFLFDAPFERRLVEFRAVNRLSFDGEDLTVRFARGSLRITVRRTPCDALIDFVERCESARHAESHETAAAPSAGARAPFRADPPLISLWEGELDPSRTPFSTLVDEQRRPDSNAGDGQRQRLAGWVAAASRRGPPRV